jgi:hypothetical protein
MHLRRIMIVIKSLKWSVAEYKPLLMALIFSVLIHLLLLHNFLFKLPKLEAGHKPFEVQLHSLQLPQETVATSSTKSMDKPQPQLESVASLMASDQVAEQKGQKKTPADAISTTAVLNEQAVTLTTSNALLISIEASADMKKSVDTAKELASRVYQYVETEFEASSGDDAKCLAITRIVFNLDKNGTYILTSTSVANDISSQFKGTRIQKSEGVISKQGLMPGSYSDQTTSEPSKTQSARFDWSAGVLQLSSTQNNQIVNLDMGTQDSLSVMYQFMFSPPLQNTTVTMTDGLSFGSQNYAFLGDISITTKLGELKTSHLLISGYGKEKTELWLGLDYQYLPVKIRKTDKNGNVVELNMTKIYTALP